jgi:hypothetical protein
MRLIRPGCAHSMESLFTGILTKGLLPCVSSLLSSKRELLIDIALVVPTRCSLVFFSVIKFELLLDIVLDVPTGWGHFSKLS